MVDEWVLCYTWVNVEDSLNREVRHYTRLRFYLHWDIHTSINTNVDNNKIINSNFFIFIRMYEYFSLYAIQPPINKQNHYHWSSGDFTNDLNYITLQQLDQLESPIPHPFWVKERRMDGWCVCPKQNRESLPVFVFNLLYEWISIVASKMLVWFENSRLGPLPEDVLARGI